MTPAARDFTEVAVEWCDDAQMMEKAKARGWTEAAPESIHDLVDESECQKQRAFPSITKAKAWASRNKGLDFWKQPTIAVHQWPDVRKISWQRETVRRLRYVGDGLGWEEVCA